MAITTGRCGVDLNVNSALLVSLSQVPYHHALYTSAYEPCLQTSSQTISLLGVTHKVPGIQEFSVMCGDGIGIEANNITLRADLVDTQTGKKEHVITVGQESRIDHPASERATKTSPSNAIGNIDIVIDIYETGVLADTYVE